MRPYTLLLSGCALGAVVAFSACNAPGPGGRYVVGTASSDLGTVNGTTQQTATPFNQNAGGADAVLTNPAVQSTLAQRGIEGGTGPRISTPPAGGPGTYVLAAAAQGLASMLRGPGTATFAGTNLREFSAEGTTLQNTGGLSGNLFGDNVIAWGRWSYNPNLAVEVNSFFKTTTNGQTTLGPSTGGAFHFLIGTPTPVANLPASGVVNYSLFGSTHPTTRSLNPADQNANALLGASMAVLWGGADTRIGIDFLLAMTTGDGVSHSWQATSTGGLANPGASQIRLVQGTSTFSGSIGATTTDPTKCVFMGRSCSASVNGLFAGSTAERAGFAYEIVDPGSGPVIWGTAAFTAGSTASPGGSPTPPGGSPTPPGGSPTPPGPSTVTLLSRTSPIATTFSGGPNESPFLVSNSGSVAQNADGSINSLAVSAGVGSFTRGTTSSSEVGGDTMITWGRWTDGTPGGVLFGGSPGALSANQALHYIAGVPTPTANLPASGNAIYTMMGATSPTFGNGVGGPGTVTAGALSVAWGGAATTKIGLDVSLTMAGDTSYRIQTTGGIATPGNSQIGINAGTSLFSGNVPMSAIGRACNGGGCSANIAGFFAGNAAERAGVAFGITNGNLANGVFGAAAFRQ
jgi:hypothetical protein